jgi:hypothetical protein
MKKSNNNILKEALGVPEGILVSAERLYRMCFNRIIKITDPILKDSDEEVYKFVIKSEFKISDYTLTKINLMVEFVETDQIDSVELYSMGFGHKSSFNDESLKLITFIHPNEILVSIKFAITENTTISQVIKYCQQSQSVMTSSLAHELKHAYDHYKKPEQSLQQTSVYHGLQKTSFGIKPINEFLHYLYFTHGVENLVRPTEFASLMKTHDIDKKVFYDFLTNSKMYTMMRDINNFTYEGLRSDLKNYIPQIDRILNKVTDKTFDSDEEKIDEILRLVYINLINNTLDTTKSIMTNDFFEDMMGFRGKKDVLFKKIIKSVTKFESNIKNFYLYEEKKFKYISGIMMKKLAKLYSMAKDEKSSIQNWDLHHKINRTNENIKSDYKFKRKLK